MGQTKKARDTPDGGFVARGVPLEEALHEVMDRVQDFPAAWRDRQCLMNSWLCLTIVTLVGCPFGIVGALMALLGASLYVCRCCRPNVQVSGKRTSKAIFVLALLAALVDVLVEILMVVLGTLYLSSECTRETGEEIPKTLCKWRKLVGILLLCSAAILFLHVAMSLTVFVSMRNCHHSINKYACHLKHLEESRRRSKAAKAHRRKKKPRRHGHHKARDGKDASGAEGSTSSGKATNGTSSDDV